MGRSSIGEFPVINLYIQPLSEMVFLSFWFVSVHNLKCVMSLNMRVEVARLTV